MRWLLLRGLVREQRHWLDFPSFFEAQVSGPNDTNTQVVLLDLPGFGTQTNAAVPKDIGGFVADLRQRWQQIVVPGEPCGIVAVSLGGMVALSWLAQHPKDFVAGVVINSSLGDLSPLWQRMQVRNWPNLLRAPLMGLRARERMLLGMTRHQGDLERDADRYAQIGASSRPRVGAAWKQLQAAMKAKSPQRIEVPTLVLASRGDELVSYKCSAAIAQRLSLPLQLHEGRGADAAGHDLPVDAPDWVCTHINDWLHTLRPSLTHATGEG